MPAPKHIAALYEWQTPDAFCSIAADERNRLGTATLTGHHSNVREALVAGPFAPLAYPGYMVRLVENDPPDFELGPDPIIGFEVAEALEPGRRRGDEYRSSSPKSAFVKPHMLSPEGELKAITDSLAAITLKKSNKAYGPGTRLVVYLDIPVFFAKAEAVLDAAQSALQPATGRFAETWLFWKKAAYLIQPNRPFASP